MEDRAGKAPMLLGFAQKAGKLVSGDTAAQEAILRGKARLIIVAEDASKSMRDNFGHLGGRQGVKVIFYGKKEEIGHYIGKPPRAVVVVTETGFARSIQEAMEKTTRADGRI